MWSKKTFPYRWIIFAILATAYLWAFFQRISPGILTNDLMNDFGHNETLIGLISSACFYSYAFMQFSSGVLADKFGARHLVTMSLLITSAGSLFFAHAVTITSVVAARIIVGFGISLIFVPALVAFSKWFDEKEYALACSLIFALTGGGLLVAGAPLAWCSEQFGWRACFDGIAVFSLLLGLAVWFFVRNTPEELGYAPVQRQKYTCAEEVQAAPPVRVMFRTIFTCCDYWFLAVWFFINGGLFYSFAGLWIGPYLCAAYGMTKIEAGAVVSSLAIGQVCGPIFFGFLSSRFPLRALLLGFSKMFVALDVLIFLYFNGTLPLWAIFACAIAFTFFVAGPSGVLLVAAKERFPASMVGTVSALSYVCSMLGSVVCQPVSGYILSLTAKKGSMLTANSFIPLFIMFLVMACIASISGFLYRKTRN